MSPNHPPRIDLESVQDKRDDVVARPRTNGDARPKRDMAALAIETASRNGNAGTYRSGDAKPEQDAGLPVPRLGAEAAENMTRLAKAAAGDIRQLGRLALEAGKRVQDECEQMAADVEANGGTVALHLTGLSQLLADVGMSNRETLRRLLGEASPSIVPPTNGASGQPVKEPAAAGPSVDSIPFAKKERRPE